MNVANQPIRPSPTTAPLLIEPPPPPGSGPPDRYDAAAPWPSMRGRLTNTGCNRQLLNRPVPRLGLPVRVLRTGNGVFSTPVVGARDTVYVGSADKNFYAFDPFTGEVKFTFPTRECIDSAACLGADGRVYVASCDATIYALDAQGREAWRFNALRENVGFTPSTIYWWEGNLQMGPNGDLYAGNDNFYLYCLDPTGRVRWASPTGMNIWSTPAFDSAGRLFGASFDMHVFALDAQTGKERWRTHTGNLVAASPAVGADGQVYIGNLGGTFLALEGHSGRVRWRLQTGGHIYASAAVAPDGRVAVGSADGLMYCLDGTNGALQWTFYTGDAIRGSAAIGPDPEGQEPYLIYFGGGNGQIYALTPQGQRRWSYDTCALAPEGAYHSLNASMALGEHGLCTASVNGDVVWIPYDAYLQHPGFDRTVTDGYPAEGASLQVLSVGGDVTPAQASAPLVTHGAQALGMRLLVRQGGQTIASQLDPDSVAVRVTPDLPCSYQIQPDGRQLVVQPRRLPAVGTSYTVEVQARTKASAATPALAVSQTLTLQPARVAHAPRIEELVGRPLRLSHLSIYDPAVVPSFDQIGLASLAMDLQVVEVNATTGGVVAWGVLPFGGDAEDAVGVPRKRHLFFAFNGSYRDGHLQLEAQKPWFEITAAPVPLDRLSLTCTVPPAGGSVEGGSIVAEVAVPSLGRVLFASLRGQRPTALKVLSGLQPLKPPGARHGHGSRWSSWTVARRGLAFLWELMRGRVHRAWNLLDDKGRFHGVGTFRMNGETASAASTASLESVRYARRQRQVIADVAAGADEQPMLGLAVVDRRTGKVVPLDYNAATQVNYDARTKNWRATLDTPRDMAGGQYYRVLVLDRCRVLGAQAL